VWLHSPELAQRAQQLGEQVRFHSRLPPRIRELAILVTARFWSAQIEWSVHEPAGREAGIPRAVIEDIKRRRTPEFERRDEESVYKYTFELLRDHFVEDDVFSAAAEHLGPRGVNELTILIGYYSLVALSLNAFRIPVPSNLRPLLSDVD